MQSFLQCGRYRLPLHQRPLVMGILNVTPDSFADGGQFYSLDSALTRAEQMIDAGVDIIDIGGESSRPGAPSVSVEEELQRVIPTLHALRDCGKPLSVDTYKALVMREALLAGADMINDINAFQARGALEAVKNSNCALCVMHMQNTPQTMQAAPTYNDVVQEVTSFLSERTALLKDAGIAKERLCIDPGFGFGKTLTHNLALLNHIDAIQTQLNLPLLAGLSRKSMIGALTGKPTEQRLAGSLAAALIAVLHGARIVRVHDVVETIDALKVWNECVS